MNYVPSNESYSRSGVPLFVPSRQPVGLPPGYHQYDPATGAYHPVSAQVYALHDPANYAAGSRAGENAASQSASHHPTTGNTTDGVHYQQSPAEYIYIPEPPVGQQQQRQPLQRQQYDGDQSNDANGDQNADRQQPANRRGTNTRRPGGRRGGGPPNQRSRDFVSRDYPQERQWNNNFAKPAKYFDPETTTVKKLPAGVSEYTRPPCPICKKRHTTKCKWSRSMDGRLELAGQYDDFHMPNVVNADPRIFVNTQPPKRDQPNREKPERKNPNAPIEDIRTLKKKINDSLQRYETYFIGLEGSNTVVTVGFSTTLNNHSGDLLKLVNNPLNQGVFRAFQSPAEINTYVEHILGLWHTESTESDKFIADHNAALNDKPAISYPTPGSVAAKVRGTAAVDINVDAPASE
nr:TPA_asm: hypothetical protein [Polynigra virus 1]